MPVPNTSAEAMNSGLDPKEPSSSLKEEPMMHADRLDEQLLHGKKGKMSYLRWCASLTKLVLRTKSNFSWFVKKTIQLQRTSCSTPGLFPIPMPDGGWFDRMPSRMSQQKRKRVFMNRAVSIICLALSFWHEGGFPDEAGLKRRPNSLHYNVYRRIRALIRSEGLADVDDLTGVGRQFPQLIARLAELSDCLTQMGPSTCPYDRFFSGTGVPVDNSVMEELSPYRDLCADRLKLTGSANWSPLPYLDDELYMAYAEPASIFLKDRVPGPRDRPV